MYNNVKAQLVDLTDLLVKNEASLDEKNKQISALKDEVARLEKDFDATKKELSDVKEKQRRTMEDLSRAAKLNSALQENLINLYQNADTGLEEKEKADKLKQELEMLLK